MTAADDIRRTTEWKRVKKQAKRRDQYRCQSCGWTEADWAGLCLEAHHIKAVEDGGTNDLKNLVTLCSRCHTTVHFRGPENGVYPVSIIPDRSSHHFSDQREYTPNEKQRQLINLLRENGPTQKKDILEETDIADWEFQHISKGLIYRKYIGRVRRGVYGYITAEEYERVEREIEKGKDPNEVRYRAYTPDDEDPREQE